MDRRTDILINLDLTLFTYLSKHKLLNQFINNILKHPTFYQYYGEIDEFNVLSVYRREVSRVVIGLTYKIIGIVGG